MVVTVRSQDASGRRFKAKIDPETLAVVKFKHFDGHRDQERRRTPGARRPLPGIHGPSLHARRFATRPDR